MLVREAWLRGALLHCAGIDLATQSVAPTRCNALWRIAHGASCPLRLEGKGAWIPDRLSIRAVW